MEYIISIYNDIYLITKKKTLKVIIKSKYFFLNKKTKIILK